MRQFNFISLLIIAIAIVLGPVASLAATITVRKDGTGDYTQVQSALDAAASGDSVLIGPGEYTELVPSYIPGYAWDVEVCAYIRVSNLTIIGAGAGQTILGPTTYLGSTQTFSPKAMVWLEGSDRRVSGITFRNCYEGIHVTNGPVYVDDCEFVNNGGYGIIWHTEVTGGWVRNSQFSSNIPIFIGLGMLGSGSGVLVQDCVFDNSYISIKNIQKIDFVGCEMKNALVGFQFYAGAKGTIDGCNIYNCANVGVSLSTPGTYCEISDSQIASDITAVKVSSEAELSVSDSILMGGSYSVMYYVNPGPVEVHNSHFIKGTGLAIRSLNHQLLPLVVHDLTGNYWGSTDSATIASWIWDQNDDPTNFSIVNFLPLADGPVSVETKSWGGVKALFR